MKPKQKMQAIAGIVRAWADPDAENMEGANPDSMALRAVLDVIETCSYCDLRQELLRRALGKLREADRQLEDEFGGYYLSAPTGTPLATVRKLLRVEP